MMLTPLFYFKPSVCWIDDDQILLDAIQVKFQKKYHCVMFHDPLKAVKYIDAYESPLLKFEFKREYSECDTFGAYGNFPVNINIPLIKTLLDSPYKRDELAVLVVDYNMPKKNGIDICERYKNLPIKKILLTGEADAQAAVEAFNQGIIDRFIKKDSNVSMVLQKYIDELIYQFFCDRSANLVSSIEASKLSIFSDIKFINFFNNLILKNKIDEFYLINKHGSYILKNEQGNLYNFIAMSESDIHEFIRSNEELVVHAKSIFDEISFGKVIPFFGLDKESWDIPIQNWLHFVYPAQALSGRENYYWALING